jgi:hypothetical protein
MLIHDASVNPDPLTVKQTHPPARRRHLSEPALVL